MATELAKAYVQIVPSAQGIQGGITEALGGEASAAGTSLGGKLMSTIKGVLATAALGKVLADTITQGAELEQSIGGIETLFKDSADTVKQNAANAYQTAGMSANEYMSLTTSFSASLLQSLGGDTAAAAEISNTAMTDMSDNANKMGTNMEDVKNAYQGFAKQNYTMLDNLKLGYGGTKTEMERLLTDAQKVSGVKYDINNLSDVYSAIHVIQGELDITGTTAKEAASTLSGSMGAMKAAFQNVMGQIALGQDIGPALSGLAQTVTTFLVGNLLPAVWNILRALPGALITFIQTFVPQMVGALADFLPQLSAGISTNLPLLMLQGQTALNGIITGITQALPGLLQSGLAVVLNLISGVSQNLPQMLTQGTAMLNTLVTGVLNALPQIIDAAIQAVTAFLTMIVANLPQIIESGKSILLNLVQGIANALPKLLVSAANMVITLLGAIVTHLPEIISAGFGLLVSLITGIGNALPQIIDAAGEVVTMFWNAIQDEDWLELGKNIIRGLIDGISGMGDALWDAVVNVAKSAEDAIKDFFGIASPSKLMRDEVGKYIPAGIAVGITGNTDALLAAVDDTDSQVTARMQQTLLADTASANRTMRIQPSYAGTADWGDVNINVYGAQGQDITALATIVAEKINTATQRRVEAFA